MFLTTIHRSTENLIIIPFMILELFAPVYFSCKRGGGPCHMDTFFYFIYYRFDIRLMKEGRMKGQGFIIFPTEEAAEKALHDTNGYVLNGKPMAVVSFLVNVKKWVISYGC